MSEVVRCDICGKTDDGHALNGFSGLSFSVRDKNGFSIRKHIDLCPEHTTEMANLVLDWVEEEKKNFI